MQLLSFQKQVFTAPQAVESELVEHESVAHFEVVDDHRQAGAVVQSLSKAIASGVTYSH